MTGLRLLVWPLLLLPGAWFGWQALHPAPPALTLDNGAYLEWGDCWFETSWLRPVHCGRFHTAPETGAQPERFALPVVYLAQRPWRRERPPTLYIAGGPGGSSWLEADEVDFWFDWFDVADWPGDLVLYDQRGVGLSDPAVGCPELQALRRALLPLPLPTEEAYQRVRDATRACHDRLQADGVDLARFTTADNAADAADLMRTLDVEQWTVYGVSYGTRVALQMMRDVPERLAAVVLDSPYPPQVNPELADAWLLQRAFGLFSRICELADDCPQTPQQLDALLERAFERVAREKIRLTVRDPLDGSDLAVVYDHEDLAWLLFEALYQWDVLAALPESVRALGEGRLDSAMRSLIQDSVDNLLDDALSDAVASSVDCHDAGPVAQHAAERQLALHPRVAAIKRFDWAYHACRYWESGAAPASFRTPVASDVPTLLLAGEFDPVTPAEWAELALRDLPRGRLFVFPAVGHGVLDSHVCAADLVRAFLARPVAPAVPKCLDRL
ncbi:MAG: alpha/beta hydrolase [Gammaproteobacteria bacterium]|nr:alpha/beta hydrolase [Gammaproteobacteria bacterium]